MANTPKINFNFARGLHRDGGPLFVGEGFYRGGLNTVHRVDGRIKNRPGIEIIAAAGERTITELADATNIFLASMFYGEFNKNDGSVLKAYFIRWGREIKVYTSDITGIDLSAPDYTFTLDGVSDEALYYRTQFSQVENTVIMTLGRSPIYKIVWGDKTSGSETFSAFRIELAENNEELLNIPYANTIGKEIQGWFSVDIPLVTGTTSYSVLTAIIDAVPGYSVTVYTVDSNNNTTYLDPANYTYSEALDSDTLQFTGTIVYSAAATGTTLRIYFGRNTLVSENAALQKEDIEISSFSKDYAEDNSYAPRIVEAFAGRHLFAGLDGPLDETDDATYSALGNKFKKIWISPIFPQSLTKEETTRLNCKQNRGLFDKDDNLRAFSDGGVIEPDNSNKLLGIAAYGPFTYIVANNGVWQVSGRDRVFSIDELIIEKIIDDKFVSREPIVSTEVGIFVAGENEVYWISPGSQQPVVKLVDKRIESYYRQVSTIRKRQSFIRYDSYNKRVCIFFADNDSTGANKYNTANLSTEWIVFDVPTNGWFNPHTCSGSDWGIMDMLTVPAESYFGSTDHRVTNRSVNMVLLARKDSNYTTITLGILEGKPYCADFYGTTYKTAFESYVETYNELGGQISMSGNRQVARITFLMERQEKADASSGFYTYPGAVYMSRRWDFADNENAGPLFDYALNSGQTAWAARSQQIYFPSRYGFTGLGGTKPGTDVIKFKTKLRGRGSTVAFRFGNDYGTTDLTGTIQEQEKGWGLHGYEIIFKEFKE